ncbi:Ig-like domain-containing protein [Pedobacter rhodius]|uniref:Ig-like domain-containing protein n=1 Tax=Pedobacter rhodius TaxID=3004098 RepID=A0ABT4KX03_9SPHI|nr:Ig-like domain-containing protein [Pedobacter sp. SJ11]MCZ4223466.1 Ig-like domain-containing protein [Pedobacter sp. SJ11]
MKKIIYLLLVVFLASCKKEDKIIPTLSFIVPTRAVGDPEFTIRAPQSNSDGSFSYSSSNAAVATVSGTTIRIAGVGTTTIKAVQSASRNYGAAEIETTFTVVPTGTLVAGQFYAGGIIVHLLTVSGVQRGYIVSEDDISTSAPWTPGSLDATTATGTAIGTGAANTAKIIATFGDGSYAAKLCTDYRGGGYTDWFLPSSLELSLLGTRKSVIGNIAETVYWSSSEVSTNIGNANYVFMGPAAASSVTGFSKTYRYKVRAFRYF